MERRLDGVRGRAKFLSAAKELGFLGPDWPKPYGMVQPMPGRPPRP